MSLTLILYFLFTFVDCRAFETDTSMKLTMTINDCSLKLIVFLLPAVFRTGAMSKSQLLFAQRVCFRFKTVPFFKIFLTAETYVFGKYEVFLLFFGL